MNELLENPDPFLSILLIKQPDFIALLELNALFVKITVHSIRTPGPPAPGGDGYRPVVYVCSPYSGNVEENVQNARRYCRFALV